MNSAMSASFDIAVLTRSKAFCSTSVQRHLVAEGQCKVSGASKSFYGASTYRNSNR